MSMGTVTLRAPKSKRSKKMRDIRRGNLLTGVRNLSPSMENKKEVLCKEEGNFLGLKVVEKEKEGNTANKGRSSLLNLKKNIVTR